MKNKFGSLVWLIAVVTALSAHGVNKDTPKMAEAVEGVSPGTLVVFDIDNTILHTKQTLGSVQWHDWYTQGLAKTEIRKDQIVDRAAAEWIRVQKASESELIEKDTPALVQALQAKGIRVVALTARPVDAAILKRTRRDLVSLGFHFDKSWPKGTKFKSPFPGAYYDQGVIFVGQKNSKGAVLKAFMSQNRVRPKAVRFIDDKQKYLDSVGPEVEAMGLPFAGFRYGGADPRVNGFDANVAAFQADHFNRTGVIVSDDTARQLMKKEKVMKRALIVVTSHDKLGDTGRKTGYYLPEVTHPYFAMAEKGIEIDIASPTGGKAPMDESSRDLKDPANRRFLENPELAKKLENTIPVKAVDPDKYDAILYAGGHGTMFDFPQNETMAGKAARIYEKGGVVAAVCHGPAALVNLKLSDGKYLVADKAVAGFTNDEEEAAKLTKVMPFLLESKLVERGARFEKAPNFQPKVVVSDRLVTGQNPASAAGVGEAIAEILTN